MSCLHSWRTYYKVPYQGITIGCLIGAIARGLSYVIFSAYLDNVRNGLNAWISAYSRTGLNGGLGKLMVKILLGGAIIFTGATLGTIFATRWLFNDNKK